MSTMSRALVLSLAAGLSVGCQYSTSAWDPRAELAEKDRLAAEARLAEQSAGTNPATTNGTPPGSEDVFDGLTTETAETEDQPAGPAFDVFGDVAGRAAAQGTPAAGEA
jgi:hypothetical protein